MQTMVQLLQQQLRQVNAATQQLAVLADILKTHSNGQGVREATAVLEPLLSQLEATARQQEAYLQGAGCETAADWLAAQPQGEARQLAGRLLAALGVLQPRMRQALQSTRQLLRQSNNYITFHINVMNQAQASDTYAPPGAATVENRRGVRMFDANV
ncbi:MAG: hypothetical protein II145_02905 [Selenomonas sp.]|jgi:flagellar biosynthesis/type III secretory pathway chaperone|nr:hypothetical protein [Selenomonas sp.]MDD6120871.1 hypothetical protein [Selenomonadaceae bacterium]MDD7056742.1 hypothetical protein [Selenomonadaceae bacterium]MDY3916420.1 hypothetical protein [Selenomonadaceae bacterium]HBT79688.1 hypothetical protein [Selenomonas sp.]